MYDRYEYKDRDNWLLLRHNSCHPEAFVVEAIDFLGNYVMATIPKSEIKKLRKALKLIEKEFVN